MKGKLKKTFLIALFFVSFFVIPQNANANGNDARIDGQYPIGVSSDYMMTAGNRIRHIGGSTISGRFMANSMAFDSLGFNDWGIWNNTLNTYNGEDSHSADDFYEQLWNPGVVINDFTKEKSISDPTFKDPTTQLTANIIAMWPYVKNTPFYKNYPESQKRVRFITDTSKEEVKNSLSKANQKLVDVAWNNNFDTKTDSGEIITGLSDLTQFKDNNVTKYLSQNTNVAGRSVETDIQDVSQYYNNLASGDDTASSFTSSDSRIVDDNTENPQYIAESDTSVAAVVINVKRDPNIAEGQGKPVVAVSIDKQKMIEAVKKAGNSRGNLTGMHILFNFSKEFYNDNGTLNAKKVPYIVLNYKGFTQGNTPGQFTWGDTDGFGVGEIKDDKLINEKYMNEALGVVKDDWNNSQVLWMGSQILNNFTDIYDLDNYPESSASSSRDMAGLGNNAAVYFKSKTHLMYGSFIIPHGSFYAGNASGASFVGGITAANNITIDGYGAPISPDQNDGAFGVFGRKENGGVSDFPTLNKPGNQLPETTISSIDLINGGTQKVSSSGGSASFDYSNGSLKPLPESGIKASIHVRNAPQKFGLYYKLKNADTWIRLGSGEREPETTEDTQIDISDLESLLVSNSNFDKGKVKNVLEQTDSNHMGYALGRTNEIEFAVTNDYDRKSIDNKSITAVSKFSINLIVNGTLEVTVPKNLDMGKEYLGHRNKFVRKIEVNEVSTPYKKYVAAQIDGNTPILNVYNPMKYKFKLNLKHVKQDKTNPLKMTDNFGYQLTDKEPKGDYLSIVDGSSGYINVLNRKTDSNSSIDPIDPVDPENPNTINKIIGYRVKSIDELLQNKTMYFNMPYSNSYNIGEYKADLTWNLDLN
ncbi:hypothetical protein RD055328_01250 [Companilactobacillus sp. RD055328]|uniref:hypothetical protein n=1 Tax=Companilactobacillus sp. RD055328 TaxID=2916634 RepID=UPI001FC81776|nr:hypothetical protein [Companilactobacillus sp. RD055328]GKQ42202.1 hypothetical protein RD055328_01250 [Companilactobacillus sp. RD055328]